MSSSLQGNSRLICVDLSDENKENINNCILTNTNNKRKQIDVPVHNHKGESLQDISNITTLDSNIKVKKVGKIKRPVEDNSKNILDIFSDFLLPKADHRKETINCIFQHFSDYSNEIQNHFLYLQSRMKCDPNYMKIQEEIDINMRNTLIGWLYEVAEDFSLQMETFHLSIHYLNNYLSKRIIKGHYFQLLGITCLFIASKYEEMKACHVNSLVEVCDYAYTTEELFAMEQKILQVLKFDLQIATSLVFSENIIQNYSIISPSSSCDKLSKKEINFYRYIINLSLFSYELLAFLPSEIAIASALISIKNFRIDQYDQNITIEEGKRDFKDNVEKVTQILNDLIKKANNTPKSKNNYHRETIDEAFYSSVKPLREAYLN